MNHCMNFDDIKTIKDLEKVSEETVWQNFERLAGFIFEKNNYVVKINTLKTAYRKRRQYDVIARNSNKIFLIECKKWAGNRHRLSALKRAIALHKERTTFYRDITGEDAIPVLVTLIEEEIRVYEGVPIVPMHKLNSFINELGTYTNEYSFGDYKDHILFPDNDLAAQSVESSGECECHD